MSANNCPTSTSETLRIDKWLWHVRFARTRSAAQALVQAGHIRLNGRRIEKAGHVVRVGDVMTLVLHGDVQAIRITALPPRRLGAEAAALCWESVN